MSEFAFPPQGPNRSFEILRAEVQADLLADEHIYGLVAGALETETANGLVPSFSLNIQYPTATAEERQMLGVTDDTLVVGVGLMVESSGHHKLADLPGVSVGMSFYSYINIGYFSADQTSLGIYDTAGRLHVAGKDEKGFVFKKDSADPVRRKAFAAWQTAHNKLLRASRQNPAMSIDPGLNIWTDKDTSSGFYCKEDI